MTENNDNNKNNTVDPELLGQLLNSLRVTVANQQLEIIDLKAQLALAESRLEKLQNPED